MAEPHDNCIAAVDSADLACTGWETLIGGGDNDPGKIPGKRPEGLIVAAATLQPRVATRLMIGR